jgi:hypothetical protein
VVLAGVLVEDYDGYSDKNQEDADEGLEVEVFV